ncbi:hypothetical protein Bca4012_006483 [Brassica carinata]
MIWDGNHWVGLCISLTDWRVLVLDLNPRLKDIAAVWGLMEAVSKMLPYLVEKVCLPLEDGAYSLEPFTVERMGGAYENHKSGDCGPVALKFMELHALGTLILGWMEVPKLDFSSPKTVEEDATLAKHSVVDEETDGEGSTSEGEGGDSDVNGDKQVMELSDVAPC